LTLGSNGAIREAVRLGLGLSLTSRVSVEHELRAGTLAQISVRGGLPQREWYALHSATVPPRPAVEQFLPFRFGPEARLAFDARPGDPSPGARSRPRCSRATSRGSRSRSSS